MADSSLIVRPTCNVKASYWYYTDLDNDPETTFPAKNIDSQLFTHLFCGFANIDPKTYKVIISDENISTFTKTVQEKNPRVQTLLSIGGRYEDYYPSMAANAQYRKVFIDSSIYLARLNGFHGLDLVWMYPNHDEEMTNLEKLLVEFRRAIQEESEETEAVPLLLTAGVYYSPDSNSYTYPIKAIAENLDWVNLMSYDFYGPLWSPVTKPSAALYDPLDAAGLSGDSGLSQWINANLPADKIVLGFPYFGVAYMLDDPEIHGYDAPVDGPAMSLDGNINYDKIKNFIEDNKATTVYDPTVIGHYCYFKNAWIGYDDNESIVSKVKYAKEKGLLGYFSWNVGADVNCDLSRAASIAWDTSTEVTTTDQK